MMQQLLDSSPCVPSQHKLFKMRLNHIKMPKHSSGHKRSIATWVVGPSSHLALIIFLVFNCPTLVEENCVSLLWVWVRCINRRTGIS